MGEAEHPYGPEWETLHQQTLERDGHACTRCGANDRTLQAHHVVPRGAGGPDDLENLVTLCRPCHGVMHPENGSFDDVRHEAPLFPEPDAPEAVARMRSPADQVCDRCATEHADPTELVAWHRPDGDEYHVLCRPCGALVLQTLGDCQVDDLHLGRPLRIEDFIDRHRDASVRPSLLAPDRLAIRREPVTVRERLVDDTVARFFLNNWPGRIASVTAALVVLLLVV